MVVSLRELPFRLVWGIGRFVLLLTSATMMLVAAMLASHHQAASDVLALASSVGFFVCAAWNMSFLYYRSRDRARLECRFLLDPMDQWVPEFAFGVMTLLSALSPSVDAFRLPAALFSVATVVLALAGPRVFPGKPRQARLAHRARQRKSGRR